MAPILVILCVLEEAYYVILLAKTTAAQNKVALTYYRVCGLYFLAVVFVRSIVNTVKTSSVLSYFLQLQSSVYHYQ